MTLWAKRNGTTPIPVPVWSSSANVETPAIWTEATRPTANLFDGYSGFNTDFRSIESYDATALKWLIHTGYWTIADRPNTASLAIGSKGYCVEIAGLEMWTGSEWTLL